MKKLLLLVFITGMAYNGWAQNDTVVTEKVDTIKIGGMIIIKKPGKNSDRKERDIVISNRRTNNRSNISTNWAIVDIGFANFNDKTNYASAEAQAFSPGSTEEQFELKTGKSVNVNIWFFMQKMNIVKHVLNLKYGVGLELNNYRFDDERVRFQENPAKIVLDEELKSAKKNKLAADYVTVPFMLNVNFTPGRRKGFGFSGGVSAGYLYSARQKVKINGDKDKLHDDFNLNKWKLSYIGELNLGHVRLYGSYATKSMWEKGLDQTPYNVGIRFSHW